MKATCRDLGKMNYKACWDLQQALFDAVVAGKSAATERGAGTAKADKSAEAAKGDNASESAEDHTADAKAGEILLVEHPPVYTLGKSGHAENLLVNRAELERLGAQFFHIDRGGDITFHGPGQLVVYPILDLEILGIGLRDYIDALEEAVIRTVACYGIEAGRIPGASGVWITGPAARTVQDAEKTGANKAPDLVNTAAPRKICAIGVRSSRYVTMHGFALNVATDLGWFSRINPCGFTDRGVTSMQRETGREIPMEEVKALVVKFLSGLLNVKIYNK